MRNMLNGLAVALAFVALTALFGCGDEEGVTEASPDEVVLITSNTTPEIERAVVDLIPSGHTFDVRSISIYEGDRSIMATVKYFDGRAELHGIDLALSEAHLLAVLQAGGGARLGKEPSICLQLADNVLQCANGNSNWFAECGDEIAAYQAAGCP
jgi:hypothetical protein